MPRGAALIAEVRVLEGEGTPLILVHSAGGNHRSFDALLPFFEGRAVLVPSFPGRGGTPGPHRETASASAAWLAELLDVRGIAKAVVAGHSVGGAIAIELALGPRRDLLAGLALLSTGARLRVLPAVLEALETAAARGGEPDLSAWLMPDPARAHTPVATALADWRMANAFDRMRDVSAIRAPTVVFSGTADTLTPPKYAAFLRDAIPAAQLVPFEGAGHDLPIERPAEVAARLLEFSVK